MTRFFDILMVLATTVTLCYAEDVQCNCNILKTEVDNLKSALKVLFRETQQTQFYIQEQTRSTYNSGIKRLRNRRHGSKSYHSADNTKQNNQGIHDHSNNIDTVGMSEVIAILNGVEFRTRHNDYMLYQKSRNSTKYGAVESLTFPPVPPEVLKQDSIENEVEEMKAWFKAWATQDYTERDYRPYFKPILCYLEGAWTLSDQDKIEEGFESDRHAFAADSFHDMLDKVRFTSSSGLKDELENFAYLPTNLYKLENDTSIVLAQWNYRILCHPLKDDLPLNRLIPKDNLKARMYNEQSYTKYLSARNTMFQLAQENKDPGDWKDVPKPYTYLDEIMSQIPGAENYPGKIESDIFDKTVFPYDKTAKDPLNVAYYSRSYRVSEPDAVGVNERFLTFNDDSIFIAVNNQSNIPELTFTKCNDNGKKCRDWSQRWTYAIPLEIIYLTPLTEWNPYGLEYKGVSKSKTDLARTVIQGPGGTTRNGNANIDKAYNGTNSITFYRTPLSFFGDEVNTDPADTTVKKKNILYSKSSTGMISTGASGHRVFIPVNGVGNLRQRYPIGPVCEDGMGVRKQLDALQELVLYPEANRRYYVNEYPNSSKKVP